MRKAGLIAGLVLALLAAPASAQSDQCSRARGCYVGGPPPGTYPTDLLAVAVGTDTWYCYADPDATGPVSITVTYPDRQLALVCNAAPQGGDA